MKRLLAYLFLVLGLGLVFSANANAAIKQDSVIEICGVDQGKANRVIYLREYKNLTEYKKSKTFKDLCSKFVDKSSNKDLHHHLSSLISKSKGMDGWHRVSNISIKNYKILIAKYGEPIAINLSQVPKSQIAKTEPSQTQEVAKKYGCIKGNCNNGYGTFIMSNGDEYVGEHKNAMANGQGTFTMVNGDKYIGEFKDDKYHGYGIALWNSGEKYVGEHKNNMGNGQGTHTLANGDIYVGGFKDDKWHGQGTYTFADGTVNNGIWKNGELVERNNVKIQIAKTEPSQTQEVAEKYCLFKPASGGDTLRSHKNITLEVKQNCPKSFVGGKWIEISYKEFKKFRDDQKTNKDHQKNMIFNVERLMPGDYYLFAHSTTGEKFWGSTKAKNKKVQVGKAMSSNGYTCELISKQKTNNPPYKGTFLLKCPDEKIDGSWTQETGNSPGLGKAFTDKGDIISVFFARNQKAIIYFVNNYYNDSQQTQISKTTQEEFKPEDKDIDNDPPVIQIAEAITVDSQSYTLEGKVQDKSKIYLTIDGRQVQVKKGKFKVDRFNIDPEEVEEIKIVAIDKWNNKTEKTIKVTIDLKSTVVAKVYEDLKPNNVKVKTDKNKIAIIIGVENYKNMTECNYCSRDAKAFKAYASRALGVVPANIISLIDINATRGEILRAFKISLPKIAGDGGKDINFFFAGHGLASESGEDLYIIPQDGDENLLEDTAISRIGLIKLIKKVKPKSVTMFFDTCYSGQTRGEQMLVASLRGIRIVDADNVPDNFSIFTASSSNQGSSHIEEAKHGMFSYYLMKGLEGKADENKDKKITNGELIAYLKTNVSKEAFTQNREQEPMLSGDPDQVLMSYR